MDRATAASLFAQNPKLVSMIQGKLGTLVGRSSGYVESLPAPIRRRVAGLKGIQKDHSKLEAEFQEEVLQLEKKYFAKFTPLYEKRASIVSGKAEPTDTEVAAGEQEAEDDEKEAEQKTEDAEPVAAGIPEFWLSAMKNQVSLAEMITDRDEEALKHLNDIRMEYLDRPGFRLIFEFGENEFFTNKTISKSYFYQEESGYGGDFIYDHAEGDTVDWKEGKDLTVRIESKKQRNKSKCSFTLCWTLNVNASCKFRHQANPRGQSNRANRIVLQLLLPSPCTKGRRCGSLLRHRRAFGTGLSTGRGHQGEAYPASY